MSALTSPPSPLPGGAAAQDSTGKVRIPLAEGALLAVEVVDLLADVCSRIAIGGSIRRGKAEVGDIEIICAPLSEVALFRRMDELLRMGHLTQRKNKNGHNIAWSNRFRAAVYKGFPLDVFIVLKDRQWGPTMVIRTGPGDANKVIVTKRGMRNNDGNIGILPPGVKFDQGAVWRLVDSHVLVDTPEEEEVFYACGLPFIAPHLRSVETYQFSSWWHETEGIEFPARGRVWLADYEPVRDAVYWPDEEGDIRARVLDVPNLGAARGDEMDAGEVAQVVMFGKRVEYG